MQKALTALFKITVSYYVVLNAPRTQLEALARIISRLWGLRAQKREAGAKIGDSDEVDRGSGLMVVSVPGLL